MGMTRSKQLPAYFRKKIAKPIPFYVGVQAGAASIFALREDSGPSKRIALLICNFEGYARPARALAVQEQRKSR
jgi:hypothetical protein